MPRMGRRSRTMSQLVDGLRKKTIVSHWRRQQDWYSSLPMPMSNWSIIVWSQCVKKSISKNKWHCTYGDKYVHWDAPLSILSDHQRSAWWHSMQEVSTLTSLKFLLSLMKEVSQVISMTLMVSLEASRYDPDLWVKRGHASSLWYSILIRLWTAPHYHLHWRKDTRA